MTVSRLLIFATCVALGCAEEDKLADGYDCGDGTHVEDGSCVPDGETDADADADADADTDADADADADVDSEPGVLPAIPAQAGVVYVSDYIDPKLRWYDISGDAPEATGDLDAGSTIHDLAVDSINNILAAALDLERKVILYRVDDPSGGIETPTALSEIAFEEPPYLVQLDPYNDRLYVHSATFGVGKVTIVDVSTPSAPTVIHTADTPIFGSWSLDAPRQIIFLFNGTDETLEVYDVGGDTMEPVEGSPIDLREAYPEENSWAFQAFGISADPWSARVYAGRTQGNLSELIAYSYDDFIPGSSQNYSDGASVETMESLPDAIDLSEELGERHVPLLFSYNPLPDPVTGGVLLVGGVFEGATIHGGVMTFDADLGPGGDCSYGDGAFCMYEYWSDSSPLWSLPTDGAGCIDSTRGVFAGAAITTEGDGSGSMQFYRYSEDGDLSPWLTSEGRMPPNGPLAVSMACH